jgi:hypothetical protein
MPANHENVGMLHMIFPGVRIIHMRRHPVDTCVSIYTTPNRVPIEYAYDRGNIVHAYKQYLRLMDHWRAVVPADRFLEVDYEELIRDQEVQLQRIVEFLGVGWDERLLRHESNFRTVITPSLWQVRQPVYTSSIERWRRYEPWLGEFKELLKS